MDATRQKTGSIISLIALIGNLFTPFIPLAQAATLTPADKAHPRPEIVLVSDNRPLSDLATEAEAILPAWFAEADVAGLGSQSATRPLLPETGPTIELQPPAFLNRPTSNIAALRNGVRVSPVVEPVTIEPTNPAPAILDSSESTILPAWFETPQEPVAAIAPSAALLPGWFESDSLVPKLSFGTQLGVQTEFGHQPNNIPLNRPNIESTVLPAWFAEAANRPANPESTPPMFLPPARPMFNPIPQLTIDVEAPANVSLGDEAVGGDFYTVTIRNNSPGTTARNVSFSANIPNNGFAFVSHVSLTHSITGTIAVVPTGGDPVNWSPTDFNLGPGQEAVLVFRMETDQNAVSGQRLEMTANYQNNGNESLSAGQNIQVGRGNLVIKKTEAIQNGGFGDTVNWTIEVANTGLGNLYNVVVTDVFGSGYINTNATPLNIAPFNLAIGERRTFNVSAQIDSCINLTNQAQAYWSIGNDANQQGQFLGTAGAPITSTADVAYELSSPNVTINATGDFNLPYCPATVTGQTINVQLSNTGGDPADSFVLQSNLNSGFTVGSTPDWTYNPATGDFTYTGNSYGRLAPGETINFSVVVTPTIDVCGGDFSRQINFDTRFTNGCNLNFDGPNDQVTYTYARTGSVAPTLTLGKRADAELTFTGDTVQFTLDFTATNVENMTGDIVITDTLPAGFTNTNLTSFSPGTAVIANGLIVWTIPRNAAGDMNGTLVFDAVVTNEVGECEANQSLTNQAEGRAGNRCATCGDLTANANATVFIQNSPTGPPSKTVAPHGEVCDNNFTMTNNYDLNITSWAGIVFTESLGTPSVSSGIDYVPGSLVVTVNGTDVTGVVVINSTAPQLELDLSGLATTGIVVLVIEYDLALGEAALNGNPDNRIFDWSILKLPGGGSCSGDEFYQGVFLNPTRANLQPQITPGNFNACQVVPVTLTVSDNDLVTQGLSASNVIVRYQAQANEIAEIDLGAMTYGGGLTSGPTSVPTVVGGNIIEWRFANGLDAGNSSGTITFNARRGCTTAPISATVRFDDSCGTTHGNTVTNNSVPSTPDLRLFVTPDTYQVNERTARWRAYVTNIGDSIAYSATFTNVFGSGFRFISATNTTPGSSSFTLLTAAPYADGQDITWDISSLAPGEQMVIDIFAEVVSCGSVESTVQLASSCLGEACAPLQEKTLTFVQPVPDVRSANDQTADLPLCAEGEVRLVVKNAAANSHIYNMVLTQTISAMSYVAGSAQLTVRDRIGNVVGSLENIPFEPVTTTLVGGDTQLVWAITDTLNVLQTQILSDRAPEETIEVVFNVQTSCTTPDDNSVQATAGGQEPCGNFFFRVESAQTLRTVDPEITLTKVGRNLTKGTAYAETVYGEPGDQIEWLVTAVNQPAAYIAENVIITDTLPSDVTFDSLAVSQGTATHTAGAITWDLGDLPADGSNKTLTIQTTIGTNIDCQADSTNSVALTYGCDDNCRSSPAQTAQATLKKTADVEINVPAQTNINICGGVISFIIENEFGPPAHNFVVTDTLPVGFEFVSGNVTGAGGTPNHAPTAGERVLTWAWTILPQGNTVVEFTIQQTATEDACFAPGNYPNNLQTQYEDSNDCLNVDLRSNNFNNQLNFQAPTLAVDKQPAYQVGAVGETINWVITVTNNGTGQAQNLVVTDVVGSQFINVSHISNVSGTVPVVGSNALTWNVGTLGAGSSWVVTMSGVLTEDGENDNQASAVANCDEGCLTTQDSDIAFASLLNVFSKTPKIQTGTIGSLVSFDLKATLSDINGDYQSIVVGDTLPTGLGFVSAILTRTADEDGSSGPPPPDQVVFNSPTTSPGLYNSGLVQWNLGNLDGSIEIDGVITAVIQNIPTNNDGVRLNNQFRMDYTQNGGPFVFTDSADVDIIEPLLHLGKTYETAAGCGATLYQTNFNTGNGGWTRPTNVNVTNGVISFTGNADSTNTALNTISDVSLSYMARKAVADNATFKVHFRQTSTTNRYSLEWLANGTVRLRRGTTTIAGPTAAINEGAWHHFEIRAVGSQLQVYVDGVQRLTATDANFASGSIRFDADNNARVEVDDILVTKVGQTGCTVGANERVTYTLTISSQGVLPAYGLVITDALPTGLTLITYSLQSDDPASIFTAVPTPAPGATGVLTWGVNQLTQTNSAVSHPEMRLTVVLSTDDNIAANSSFANQGSLGYNNWPAGTAPTPITRDYSGGSHSTAIRTVDAGLSKAIVFSPLPDATLGTLVTYTLRVPASPISATLYNVRVTDTLNVPRFFIENATVTGGVNPNVTVNNGTGLILATFDNIPHDTQAIITIQTRISDTFPGAATDPNAGNVITNNAQMSHVNSTAITTSNTVTTNVKEPAISLGKSSSPISGSIVGAGDTVAYTLRLTNSTATTVSAAYDVAVTDTLPAGMRTATPVLNTVTLNGVPVNATSYITTYTPATGQFSLVFSDNLEISPGAVVLIQYNAIVDGDIGANINLPNVASTSYSSLPGDTPGDRDYSTTSNNQVRTGGPAFVIQKTTPAVIVEPSQIITYTITATNTGIAAATGVILTDTLPSYLSYLSATVPHNETGGLITWNIGVMTAGQSISRTVVAQVNNPLTNSLAIVNPTRITSTEGVSATDRVTVTVNSDHRLWLTKTVTPAVITAGGVITYTIDWAVTGREVAVGVVISDTVPANTDFIAGTPAPTVTGRRLAWALGDQSPGATGQVSFSARVSQPLTAGLTITNVAFISDTNNGTPATDLATNTVTSSHTIQVTKDFLPAIVQPDNLLTYTIRFTITGNEPALKVTISDTTPNDTTFANAIPAASNPGLGNTGVVRWSLGQYLTPNTGLTQNVGQVTLVVRVDTPLINGTPITNVVAITDSSGQRDTYTAPVAIVQASHQLTVTKTANPGVVEAGDPLTYTIRYTITGNGLAQNVTLSDTVPPDTTFLSATPLSLTNQPAVGGTGPVTWTIGDVDLTPGIATGQVTMAVRSHTPLISGTLITNLVTLKSASVEDNDDEPARVTSRHTLVITKTASPDPVAVGNNLAYSIIWEVTGNEPAIGAVISDTIPGATTYVSCSGAPCSHTNGLVTFNMPTLNPGLGSVQVVVNVPPGLGTGLSLVNRAEINDSTGLTDNSSVTVTTQANADVSVVKSVVPGVARPNETLTYTINFANNGPSTAAGTQIVDTLPANLTYAGIVSQSTPFGPFPPQVNGQQLTWPYVNMPAGMSGQIVFKVTVKAGITNSAVNNVRISSATPDINPNNNQSSTTTPPEFIGQLGDYVWFEPTANGIQGDAGEQPISGVVVSLYNSQTGALLASTTTDATGFYQFEQLPLEQSYTVQLDPANFAATGVLSTYLNVPTGAGTGATDNNADPNALFNGQGYAVTTTLTAVLTEDQTLDFGFTKGPGRLGDYVWFEPNVNGVQGDAGEQAIPGAVVNLYDSATGNLLGTTTTDANGFYIFENLPLDRTYVVQLDPANFAATGVLSSYLNVPTGQGTGATDNNADPAALFNGNGYAVTSTLTPAKTEDLTLDFGFTGGPGRLGNRVWFEANPNGVQGDADETPLPGVVIDLYDADTGRLIMTTTTDATGLYIFEKLPLNVNYAVQLNPANFESTGVLSNYLPTQLNQGTFATDSDADPASTFNGNGYTAFARLTDATPEILSLDFGFTQGQGRLGDYVWFEDNPDGIQGTGSETPLANVKVNLHDRTTGALLASTTTDANGFYIFENLPLDKSYTVQLDPTNFQPGGQLYTYTHTAINQGPSDTDSSANPNVDFNGFGYATSTTLTVVLTEDLTLDFGFTRSTGRLGDTLWFETNPNGVQGDADETPIPGVIVKLYDAATGALIGTTTTDANGNYLFDNLPLDKTYVVQLDPTNFQPGGALEDYSNVPTGQGTPGTDNNANPGALFNGNGYAVTTTLTTAITEDLTLDFGFTDGPGRLGDYVWFEDNPDGQQGTGSETALPNVQVNLYDTTTGALIGTTTTDANGFYIFDNLPLNVDYTVQLDPANFQPGGSLFTYTNTAINQGSSTTDSSADPAAIFPGNGFGYAVNTRLTPVMTEDLTLDFGFTTAPGRIGDYVWFETTPDGVQGTGGENPIAGVIVKLYDATGNLIATTTTDATGFYIFENLPLDNTYVVQLDPANFQPGGALENYNNIPLGQGTGATDNNANPLATFQGNGYAVTTTLTAVLTEDLTLDFGFSTGPGRIGDKIWFEDTGNGVQGDGDETPIAGVIVDLYDAAGNLVATTTTDANGNYLFDNLPLDVTYVVQLNPANFSPGGALFKLSSVPPNASGNPALDSEGDPNAKFLGRGYAVTTTLTVTEPENLSLDFGFTDSPGRLGNYVWYEPNPNGIQGDAGDIPLAGVVIDLYNADTGEYLGSTTTDANGFYIFEGLPLDVTYAVQLNPINFNPNATTEPSGALADFIPTLLGQGTGASDSNANPGAIFPFNGLGYLVTSTLTTAKPEDLTLDFGFTDGPGRLGDYVWFEPTPDGQQGTGTEQPIAGVVVDLYDTATGQYLGSATTDANGYYLFENLPLGVNYTVQLNPSNFQAGGPLATYGPTAINQGPGATDSSANPAAIFPGNGFGYAVSTTLTAVLTEDLSLDFGFTIPGERGEIGDYVWFEESPDGVQGTGSETPIAGVVLNLYDETGTLIMTTTTDATGFYLFDNLLLDKTYTVQLDPANFAPGGPLADYRNTALGAGTPATDNNANPNQLYNGFGYAVTTTLTAAFTRDLTLDFGFTDGPGRLGDYVWFEDNPDGQQGTGSETPIAGVVVDLYDTATGTYLGSATTDANGFYIFENLPLGVNYTVQLNPSNFQPGGKLFTMTHTAINQGPGATDSSANPNAIFPGNGFGYAVSTTLTAVLTEDLTLDFGFTTGPGRIGDYVWFETNPNGVQGDGDETPIAGVIVNLYDDQGNLIATTTTDANGFYIFEGLPLDKTYVVQLDPANFAPGGALESYSNVPTGQGTPGTDNNANPGALFGGNGYAVTTTLTTAKPEDLTLDFGFTDGPGRLGDYVWFEDNPDGQQGTGSETPIAGVVVDLYDTATGAYLGSTTTDANGFYIFENLPLGVNYTVQLNPANFQAGGKLFTMTHTAINQGPGATDSSANPDALFNGNGFGYAVSTTLTAVLTEDLTLDFGFTKGPGRIGDYVWFESNPNGIQGDGDETPIAGVIVNLYDDQGNLIATTTTDANGFYIFDGLPLDKTYVVQLDPANFAPGGALESYSNVPTGQGTPGTDNNANPGALFGGNGYAVTTTLTTAKPEDLTLDFGFTDGPGRLGDYVWFEDNPDGQQGTGSETPIAGVVVDLYDTATGAYLGSTTTDANGFYIFENLPLGVNYTVQLNPANFQAGGKLFTMTHTAINQGPGATDSSANPDALFNGNGFGYAVSTTLTAVLTEDLTLDFGFTKGPGRIGDYVWFESNPNGIQGDGDETPIAGVIVNLYDDQGDLITTTTTDANGFYIFEGLPLDKTYVVQLDPANFAPGGALESYSNIPTGQGTPGSDNNANPGALFGGNGYAVTTTLTTAKPEDLTLDFGFTDGPGRLGDYVWFEDNPDGQQGTGSETPIAGVVVDLYDTATGAYLGSTTTDANGFYIFENLPLGINYTVQLNPSNFQAGGKLFTVTHTAINQGPGATDSSANPDALFNGNGYAVSTTLTTAQPEDLTLDFGFTKGPGRIGDYVWFETNPNGVQGDGDETPIAGVIVNLYDDQGNLIATTTTDANGFYIFDGLPLDKTYVVQLDPANFAPGGVLADYAQTALGQGDGASDSNANPGSLFNGNGYAVTTTLTIAKPEDLTLDFGFTDGAQIGDYVWIDFDGDGLQDENELGIPGVILTITYPDGQVYTTTTDNQGHYTFTVPVGQVYTITIPPINFEPGGALLPYEPTLTDGGDNDNQDSDGLPTDNGIIIVTPVITGDNDSFDFGFIPNEPSIRIQKEIVSSTPVYVGESIRYVIRIINSGNITLSTIPLSDLYDADYLTFNQATLTPDGITPNVTSNTSQLSWADLTVEFGDLPPGGVITIGVVMTATRATPSGQPANNIAIVDGATTETGDTLPSTEDQGQVPVTILPYLGISKKVVSTGPVMVGDEITFTISLTNLGQSMIVRLPLQDRFDPTYLSYLRAVPTADQISNAVISWTDLTVQFGDLPPGDSLTVQVVFRAMAATDRLVNRAVVDNGLDVNNQRLETSDEVLVSIGRPVSDLQFDKRVVPSGVVSPGDRLAYSLCYSNSGTATISGVVITDTVPVNTTYVPGSAVTNQGTIEFYNGTVWSTAEPSPVVGLQWLLGDVPADGQTRCVDFAVTVNTDLVTTNENNQRLTLQYTGNGWRLLDRSPLKIYLPLVTYDISQTDESEVQPQPIITAPTDLSAAETLLPLATFNLDIINRATIGSDETPQQTDTVSNTLLRQFDPIVTKEADVAEARAGDLVHYSVTIFNPAPPSNVAATDVILWDVMPLQLDLVSYEVSRPELLTQVTVVTEIVPVVGHPLGINQATATTISLTIPVLEQNEQVTLRLTTRVNDLANPPPQLIRNIAFVESPALSIPPPPEENIVQVPLDKPTVTPTPTPTRTPNVDNNDDDDDDNDGDSASAPPPPPVPTGQAAIAQAAPPTATPGLPVFLLPETGYQEAESRLWLLLLGLLIAGSLGLYWRRRLL